MSDDARILVLETSGRVGLVGLGVGGTLLSSRRLSETRKHARDLAPTIDELLREAGWKPADVQAVAASRGPGSYTGLRVGLMTAKAFAYAVGCRVLAVDTFAAIAHAGPAEATVLDVLGDALKRQLYVQRFRRGNDGEWRAETDLTIRTAEEWLASAAPCVSGPGVPVVAGELPAGVTAVAEELRDPTLESVLALAWGRWRRGEGDDVFALEPLYARASSAELNWKK